MTISEAYSEGLRLLQNSGIEDFDFDADCIFKHIFGENRHHALIFSTGSVSEKDISAFFSAIKRRCDGEPLQYILGEWDFYDMTFFVGEGVLIPRPETETLVDIAFESLEKKSDSVVFDLCCGSGCIGLTAAAHFPKSRVYLFDISPQALKFAEKNRKKYSLDNAFIFERDITNGLVDSLPAPDIILSNPPYIPSDEIPTLQREVLREPKTALDGGADGLDFYRVISEKWIPLLGKGGIAVMEAGEEQPEKIGSMPKNISAWHIRKDTFGTDRFIVIEKGEN